MIRRSLLALAAAGALLLLPTTAHAGLYPPPGSDMETSDPSPLAGESFVVVIEGPVGSDATLQIVSPTAPDEAIEIAGARALTKTVPASGAAQFVVTLSEPGSYALTALVDGVVVERQTVTVQAVGVGGDVLSETGVTALPLVLGAGGLILVGGAGVVLAKRRQRESVDA